MERARFDVFWRGKVAGVHQQNPELGAEKSPHTQAALIYREIQRCAALYLTICHI
jgi:hypothetical protein